MRITQECIYSSFPWAKPIELEFDDVEEGFFSDVVPWAFNQKQMNLIYLLLEEVQNWFLLKDKPIKVIIVEYKEVQGHVFIEKICEDPEVYEIFEKHRAKYLGK